MQVGDLVRDIDDHTFIGIVLGRQGETTRWYVRWLTGVWAGEIGSRWHKNLEIIKSEKNT